MSRGKGDQYTKLRRELDAATRLIRDAAPKTRTVGEIEVVPPMHSLLDQLKQLQARNEARQTPTIRLFKHFGCTGGTIMAKCLAALPNTVLLSEMDPLSVNHMTSPSRFAPSDLVKQYRYSRHDLPDDLAIEVFLGGLAPLQRTVARSGQHLVLREHTHSHYCTEADWKARPSVEDIVSRDYEVTALLSVRHPLNSYISLLRNKWIQFNPKTLDEYCTRYMGFLNKNAACPIVYYEDFTDDPETVLENMSRSLHLTYDPTAVALVKAIEMSGDSGRSGDHIGARPKRSISEELAEESAASAAYAELCKYLRYPALPHDVTVGSEADS